MRLCPLLLDRFPAVYHVCPSAGLLGLLPSLQRLDEVVGAVCADEASLRARESRGKVRDRRGENVGHKTGTCEGSSSRAWEALGLLDVL